MASRVCKRQSPGKKRTVSSNLAINVSLQTSHKNHNESDKQSNSPIHQDHSIIKQSHPLRSAKDPVQTAMLETHSSACNQYPPRITRGKSLLNITTPNIERPPNELIHPIPPHCPGNFSSDAVQECHQSSELRGNYSPGTQKLSKQISHSFKLSPYEQVKKSYKSYPKPQITMIPVRKCHQALQARIVGVLNKMNNQKGCRKELEGLLDKMSKIPLKQLFNKYIISGLKSVIKLARETGAYEGEFLSKMDNQFCKVLLRIEHELDHYHQFLVTNQQEEQQQLNDEHLKVLMIKKIYRLMKLKNQQDPRILKDKAFQFYENHFLDPIALGRATQYVRSLCQ